LQALQKVGKGTAEKISLQTTVQNSRGQCRRDVTRWFIPDTDGRWGEGEEQRTEKLSRWPTVDNPDTTDDR